MMGRIGYKEVLKIGDMDRAIKIQKGELLSKGKKLSEVIELQKTSFGLKAKVFPMTDDHVVTKIKTPEKEMNFHEFWVENKGEPEVAGVYFKGIERAKPSRGAIRCLRKADGIIIGPSNPITSILPIISLKGIKEEITKRKDKCAAISPIIKNKPVSGPAAKLMKSFKLKVDSYNVASFYKDMIGSFIIDSTENESKIKEIESLGIKCYRTNTLMNTIEDKKSLSIFVLKKLGLIE
jgi:LPPG:FO 2-phospho-L-lactate transferase